MFCANCGTNIPENNPAYCPSCGIKIQEPALFENKNGPEVATEVQRQPIHNNSGLNKGLKIVLIGLGAFLAITFLSVILLRTFAIESRVIPTGSMLPTIQLMDSVVVNKMAYLFGGPERGDIIIFSPPDELNPPAKDDYIKRIIGLPGETVEISDHRVIVNGKTLEEPYLMEPVNYEWGPVEVPDDCVLVLGDNRNNSSDTHMWRDKYNHQIFLKIDRIKGDVIASYDPDGNFQWCSMPDYE